MIETDKNSRTSPNKKDITEDILMIPRLYTEIQQDIMAILKQEYGVEKLILWSKPHDTSLGDISFPLFSIAKEIGKSPQEISDIIIKRLAESKIIQKLDIKGGFLNIFLEREIFTTNLIKFILNEPLYGYSTIKKPERIIVEHTSSNPNAPLHIGNFRNSVIGDVLARLLKMLGAKVNVRYYVNDLGKQVAPLIIGYHLLKSNGFHADCKIDAWIGQIYATMNTLLEIQQVKNLLNTSNIAVDQKISLYRLEEKEVAKYILSVKQGEKEKEIKEKLVETLERLKLVQDSLLEKIPIIYTELHKLVTSSIDSLYDMTNNFITKYLEGKNEGIKEKYREVVNNTLYGHIETLKLFNIIHDDFDWESDVAWSGEVNYILEELEKNEFLRHDAKARLLENDKIGTQLGFKKKYGITYKIPDIIIVNSEGIPLYPCRDIAYHLHKLEKFDANYCYNVIGKQQQLPQLSVKLALYGIFSQDLADKITHIDYEYVTLVGRKMASRELEYVTPDELFESAKKEVTKITSTRNYTQEEQKEIAKKVAASSIKYYILKIDSNKAVVFDIKKAVDPNENTGPFLQYSYARALSILKKAKEKGFKPKQISMDLEKIDFIPEKKEEWELIKSMEELPSIYISAAESLKLDSIANFAFQIASAFHKFYDNCPVLAAETKEMLNFRLLLVMSVIKCLESLFEVMGLDILDKM